MCLRGFKEASKRFRVEGFEGVGVQGSRVEGLSR